MIMYGRYIFSVSDETQTISMVPESIRKMSSFVDFHDANRFERQNVTPTKSISESLHAHDILYGGDQNRREYFSRYVIKKT